MNNSSASGTKYGYTPVIERQTRLVLFSVFLLLGIIANLSLITIIKRIQSPRKVFEIFVLNLAAADLLYSVFYIAPNIHRLAVTRLQETILHCKVIYPMTTVAYSAGIFTIAVMSLHRYWLIVHPHKQKPSIRFAITAVAVTWFSSFVTALPIVITTKLSSEGMCQESGWPNMASRQGYTLALFFIQYGIPLLIITIAYAQVITALSRPPNQDVVCGRRVAKRNDHIRVVKTTALIVVVFALCMLPNQVAWLMIDFGTIYGHSRQFQIFWSVGDMALCLHSCLNPVVYGIMSKQFRNDYYRGVSTICCCFLKKSLGTPQGNFELKRAV